MAHWIIEDNGFAGSIYECSECRESWSDLFKLPDGEYISYHEHCPNCNAPINDDADEYICNHVMRNATKEENEIVNKYIDSISHTIIPLNIDEIEAVINIREDKVYCTFVDGYKIMVTKE